MRPVVIFPFCLITNNCIFIGLLNELLVWPFIKREIIEIWAWQSRVNLASSARRACNFADHFFSIIWWIFILLREKITKHANSILVNFFFCAAWSSATTSSLWHFNIILIISRWWSISSIRRSGWFDWLTNYIEFDNLSS